MSLDLKLLDIISTNDWGNIKLAWKLAKSKDFDTIEFVKLLMINARLHEDYNRPMTIKWFSDNSGSSILLIYNHVERTIRCYLVSNGFEFQGTTHIPNAITSGPNHPHNWVKMWNALLSISRNPLRHQTQGLVETINEMYDDMTPWISCMSLIYFSYAMEQLSPIIVNWFEKLIENE